MAEYSKFNVEDLSVLDTRLLDPSIWFMDHTPSLWYLRVAAVRLDWTRATFSDHLVKVEFMNLLVGQVLGWAVIEVLLAVATGLLELRVGDVAPFTIHSTSYLRSNSLLIFDVWFADAALDYHIPELGSSPCAH